VDTAPTYPTSEKKIGNFLRRYPDSLKVSTKIFRDQNSIDTKSGRYELEKSLERLSVDCAETLFIHNSMISKKDLDLYHFFIDLKKEIKIMSLGWCGVAHEKLKEAIEFDVAMVRANPWDDGLSKLSLPFKLKEVIGMNIFANGFWRYKLEELWRGHLLRQFNPLPSYYLNHPKRKELEDFQNYEELFSFARSKLLLKSVVVGTNNPKHLAQIVHWRNSIS
jgi:hypothetical protein